MGTHESQCSSSAEGSEMRKQGAVRRERMSLVKNKVVVHSGWNSVECQRTGKGMG